MIEKTQQRVTVQVVETTTYDFPDYPNAKCPAHGDPLCVACARNPGNCVREMGACSYYAETGMHWDTCPNRIR